jgi:hypothetical protein
MEAWIINYYIPAIRNTGMCSNLLLTLAQSIVEVLNRILKPWILTDQLFHPINQMRGRLKGQWLRKSKIIK